MGTLTYNRDKDPDFNATGIVMTGEARETSNALVAIASGTTSIFELVISGDSDESGGATVVQLYRVKLTPVISLANPGEQQLNVEVTPVNGDASDAAIQNFTAKHPQNMDAWQVDAGRPQQV